MIYKVWFLVFVMLFGMAAAMAEAPIELEADKVEFDTKKGKSTYRGNVVIVQGDLRLTGDVVEVFSEKGKIVRIFARAKPATFNNRSSKRGEPLYAEAWSIEYDVKQERVKLTGQARVDSAQRSLRSRYIVYKIETGEVLADGGKDGRVRLIVDPDHAPAEQK